MRDGEINMFFSSGRPTLPSDDITLAPPNINPEATDTKRPDRFKLNGQHYVRRNAVAKKPNQTTGKRTSPVWNYGEDIQLASACGDNDRCYYYCWLCERDKKRQELPIIGDGNSTALNHIKKTHKFNPHTGEPLAQSSRQKDASTIQAPTDGGFFGNLIFVRQLDRFKALLIRWIVYCHIAFFQLENQYFRDLILFICPGLKDYLPKARKTIQRWVMEEFKRKQQALSTEMREALSSITISFDVWTSPHARAIIGIVAHFITKDGKRRTAVLALQELKGEHTGLNMAEIIVRVLRTYKIAGRVSYFMADNAEANDVCIDAVLRTIYPNMPLKQRKQRRLRCLGHIVNLCCQDFIVGKDSEKICKEIDAAERAGDIKRIGELWKKRGSLGLLQNIVRYIRATPQRRQFFKNIKIGGDIAEFDKLEVSYS
jgi:hypothetical protein